MKACSTYHTRPVTCHWCRQWSLEDTCHSAGTYTSRGLWSRCLCAPWSTGCWRGQASLAGQNCQWWRGWAVRQCWPLPAPLHTCEKCFLQPTSPAPRTSSRCTRSGWRHETTSQTAARRAAVSRWAMKQWCCGNNHSSPSTIILCVVCVTIKI